MFSLREKLISYTPSSPIEEQFKVRILEFLHNPNAFERSNLECHITSSCWIINKDGSKALILHHKKLNRFLQPGGHNDGDTDCLNVSLKEAHEETGIENIVPVSEDIFDIDIHTIPQYKDVPEHIHCDIRFLLRVTSDEEGIHNEESNQLKWISKDDYESVKGEYSGVIRLFEKWVTFMNFNILEVV